MQLAPETHPQQSLSLLHSYGIYARTTNGMLHAKDLHEIKSLISEFMAELQLTGYLRFFDASEAKTALRFGHKPEHFIYDNALMLQKFMAGKQKLQINTRSLVFSQGPLFAFCGFNTLNASKIEPLQDILTLFFDSLANWLEQWFLKESLKHQLQNTLDDTINANEALIEKYLTTSENLSDDLSDYFLKLGLENEQEAFILKALHQASVKQAHLMEQEIKRNTALGDALIEAVDDMLNPPMHTNLSRITSVELF